MSSDCSLVKISMASHHPLESKPSSSQSLSRPYMREGIPVTSLISSSVTLPHNPLNLSPFLLPCYYFIMPGFCSYLRPLHWCWVYLKNYSPESHLALNRSSLWVLLSNITFRCDFFMLTLFQIAWPMAHPPLASSPCAPCLVFSTVLITIYLICFNYIFDYSFSPSLEHKSRESRQFYLFCSCYVSFLEECQAHKKHLICIKSMLSLVFLFYRNIQSW